MRKLLMAGVAFGAVSALVSGRPALAQQAPAATPPPAAVFPITTETDLAGVQGPSLNGAAPGSVQVNLGARFYGAMWFANTMSGATAQQKTAQPQGQTWFQLYPGFDYASPSGIHFGAQAQLWTTGGPSAGEGASAVGSMPYWHQAFGYVSSATMGKFSFGTPNNALTSMAVGTGDDFGTGMFFSWYSTTPYVPWDMGDAYDNYNSTEKVVYQTPTFSGFTAAVSFEPTAVTMNYSVGTTVGLAGTPQAGLAGGMFSRNRVAVAGKYDGTLGAVGLKADVGYVHADYQAGGAAGQDVSFVNAGLEMHVAGFELEGSVNTGQFNANVSDAGGTTGPSTAGAKDSTAWVAGAGYGAGPFKVGAVYYAVSYDDSDFGGAVGKVGHIAGEGVGGSYTVGPGVVAYLDFITASMDTTNPYTGKFGTQHPMGLGIGTFFTW